MMKRIKNHNCHEGYGQETKKNIRKRILCTGISVLLCFITSAAAGCSFKRQGSGDFSDTTQKGAESSTDLSAADEDESGTDLSETDRAKSGAQQPETDRDESGVDLSEAAKTKSDADLSETEKTKSDTDLFETDRNVNDADLPETDKNGSGTDSVDTSEGRDGTVFITDGADSISVDITAENVIVVDADADLVLYQKNSTAQIAPASTAKMIMALTALDVCSVQDQVTVGAEITMMHDDSSRAWLNQGDVLTVSQLLTALLLPSGNDAAYSLAVYTGRKIAGDSGMSDERAVDVFMDAVNEKASQIGAHNSNFAAPDGYDAEGQYTTAYDLAVIAKACLDNPITAEIMAEYKSYEKWVSGREVTYYNTNKLLDSDSPFYYPEAVGLKTGTSSLAGASLVSAAVLHGKTFISVVMGADTEDARFQESILIYDAIKALN